jgi:hypothetical protein
MSLEEKENQMDIVVEEEAVEEVDDFKLAFENLEISESLESKIFDYQELLKNPRIDESAVKIKEQCIYR